MIGEALRVQNAEVKRMSEFKLRELNSSVASYRSADNLTGDLDFKLVSDKSYKMELVYLTIRVTGNSKGECLTRLEEKLKAHCKRIQESTLIDEAYQFK